MDPAPDADLFTLVSDGAPFGFVVRSLDDRLLAFNRPLGEIFSFTREEEARVRALGQTRDAFQALAAALAAHLREPARLVFSPDAEATTGDELFLENGSVVEYQAGPARDRGGRVVARIAHFRDVTRRYQAELEIRARARQQAALTALAELAMNAQDVEPLLHAACGSAQEVLGVDAAAFLERCDESGLRVRAGAGLPLELIGVRVAPPGDVQAVLRAGGVISGTPGETVRPLLAAEGFVAAAEVGLPGTGTLGLLGVYSRTSRVFTGDELRFVEMAAGVLASAVARRHAEAEVWERERQMRAVFDSALDAMVILDDGGLVLDANPATSLLFGAPRSAIIGQSLLELAPAARAQLAGAGAVTGFVSGRVTGETEVALPGTRPRTVEFAVIPAIIPGRHLGLMRDVTERKQLHARLALADRMASVGTLAAGVAHELNNPLAYVSANLSFLAERLGELGRVQGQVTVDASEADLPQQLEDAVKDARDGAERMRVIIRDLKTFSRAEEEKAGPIELRPVIESCLNMAWNEIKHRARLVKDFGPVPPVRANEARLGQVFLNLLVNAAQAIPEGQADQNEIRVVTYATPTGQAVVEIRDTGCGIDPQHLGRIFDPFFTTKAPGYGTGLGLSICHSIVAALGGEIGVDSRRPGGTTFRVTLPASQPGPETSRRRARALEPSRPRGRILVVDDEPLVGTVIQRALQGEHDFVVSSSARAALERIEGGEQFDVVLSDLLMPEMSGMDLFHALERVAPRLARKMVFLTGGAFTPAAREFLEREPVVCVEKPFELETIRSVLARRLAEPDGDPPPEGAGRS